jgi:hypothetical protein
MGEPRINVNRGRPVGKPRKRSRRSSRHQPGGERRVDKTTYVDVDAWTTEAGLARLTVVSSNRVDLKLSKRRWTEATRNAVENRRRKDGAGKGRVLYLRERAVFGDEPPTTVAVLCYHLVRWGTVEVLHLRCATDVSPELVPIFEAVLLQCADLVCIEMEGVKQQLHWRASSEYAAQHLEDHHDFKKKSVEAGRPLLFRLCVKS